MIVRLEHPDYLLVEKPPHQLVHPTKPDGPRTLWHELLDAYPNEKLSLINRLDRETSGLVLVARHSGAASQLGKMTEARQIAKCYLALVHGKTKDAGVIEAPLDRLGKTVPSAIYLKQGVVETGYPCTTLFHRVESRLHSCGEFISLLHVTPRTGRLHQIRVHLSHIGHAVVGDKIYGPNETNYLKFIQEGWTAELEQLLWLPRHALHAHSVCFDWNGEKVECEIPMSEDLSAFWDELSTAPQSDTTSFA